MRRVQHFSLKIFTLITYTALIAIVTIYMEHRKITLYNKCTVLYGRTSLFVSYSIPYIQKNVYGTST